MSGAFFKEGGDGNLIEIKGNISAKHEKNRSLIRAFGEPSASICETRRGAKKKRTPSSRETKNRLLNRSVPPLSIDRIGTDSVESPHQSSHIRVEGLHD